MNKSKIKNFSCFPFLFKKMKKKAEAGTHDNLIKIILWIALFVLIFAGLRVVLGKLGIW